MKLEDLLAFDTIVIQCHDDPDADAIASGWGLLLYFEAHGKKGRFVYSGERIISKSNLVLMLQELAIPLEYVQTLDEEPDLLITVDCQYTEDNVSAFSGKAMAVIDHHQTNIKALPKLWEVRSKYGSCATLVWDMLGQAGFDVKSREDLATALYYGLFMDTGRLQELCHPKDKDIRDALEFACNKNKLFRFQNCNLSLEELKIAGVALAQYEYYEQYRFAVVKTAPCDPNILGIISDMLIEVDAIDSAVVYCKRPNGIKISVRSCDRATNADDLAKWLVQDVGSGGGHVWKAGGLLSKKKLLIALAQEGKVANEEVMEQYTHQLLVERMSSYFCDQEIIDPSTGSFPDLSQQMPLYEKRRLPQGYIRAADLYPVGTKIMVRMLEGEMVFTVLEDTYLIIGVEGEVYRNDRQYLLEHNDLSEESYQFCGEYAPTIRQAITTVDLDMADTQPKNLEGYAKTAIPKAGSRIYACQITKRTKVFRPWSENYMLGMPGDWLACRADKPERLYIIKDDIFQKTYDRVKEE